MQGLVIFTYVILLLPPFGEGGIFIPVTPSNTSSASPGLSPLLGLRSSLLSRVRTILQRNQTAPHAASVPPRSIANGQGQLPPVNLSDSRLTELIRKLRGGPRHAAGKNPESGVADDEKKDRQWSEFRKWRKRRRRRRKLRRRILLDVLEELGINKKDKEGISKRKDREELDINKDMEDVQTKRKDERIGELVKKGKGQGRGHGGEKSRDGKKRKRRRNRKVKAATRNERRRKNKLATGERDEVISSTEKVFNTK